MSHSAWRNRKLHRDQDQEDKRRRRFTPAQQLGAFVLLSAILCGAAGGGISKMVADDRGVQILGWLIGVTCGVGVGSLIGTWVNRRSGRR